MKSVPHPAPPHHHTIALSLFGVRGPTVSGGRQGYAKRVQSEDRKERGRARKTRKSTRVNQTRRGSPRVQSCGYSTVSLSSSIVALTGRYCANDGRASSACYWLLPRMPPRNTTGSRFFLTLIPPAKTGFRSRVSRGMSVVSQSVSHRRHPCPPSQRQRHITCPVHRSTSPRRNPPAPRNTETTTDTNIVHAGMAVGRVLQRYKNNCRKDRRIPAELLLLWFVVVTKAMF
jgi:hypothetical protein